MVGTGGEDRRAQLEIGVRQGAPGRGRGRSGVETGAGSRPSGPGFEKQARVEIAVDHIVQEFGAGDAAESVVAQLGMLISHASPQRWGLSARRVLSARRTAAPFRTR